MLVVTTKLTLGIFRKRKRIRELRMRLNSSTQERPYANNDFSFPFSVAK